MSSFNRNITTEVTPMEIALVAETPRRNPLLIVWLRRWIIVASILVSVAAAVVYLLAATPIYESSADVTIEQNSPRIIASDPTGAILASGQNYLWTQCRLIGSRAILEKVVNEPGIRDLPTFAPGADPLGALRGMVNATVGRRDDVVTISVRSQYAHDAARIANAIVIAFTKYHDSTRRSTSRELVDLLQNKMVQLEKELAGKRKEKLDFLTRNAAFTLGNDRSSPTLERMLRLSQALTEMQVNTLKAQAAYETVKAMIDEPAKVRQLLESRQFKSEMVQQRMALRSLQQQLVGLSRNYLPGYPDLKVIEDNIRQLQAEMALEDRRMIESYFAELEAAWKQAKLDETHLEELLNTQRHEVLKLNTAAAQYGLIDSELSSLERFSNEIYDRIKALSLTEDTSGLTVRAVEPAAPASSPVLPQRSTTLFFALLAGGALGTGLAFLRDWMDQRLRSADEIKQLLGMPVLGVVPHIADGNTPSHRGLLLHHDPMSDVAEAYRTIRTAVYFGQGGGIAKTILITSPSPGDGKTTLASNLAIAMAQAGNRILLLDADFRKPTQHKIFELDKRIGLSSVLAGEATLQEAIRPSVVPGLDVLPCGPIPANPSEILNSQTFADLIERLSANYDHVLLDSPPIMPVTDARILAASCDATVLALRAERSTRKGAIYARDVLYSVGSRILGAVVNDVPRRKGVYGYYYSYGEQYQYGYGPKRRTALPAPVAAPENGSSPNGTGVKQQA